MAEPMVLLSCIASFNGLKSVVTVSVEAMPLLIAHLSRAIRRGAKSFYFHITMQVNQGFIFLISLILITVLPVSGADETAFFNVNSICLSDTSASERACTEVEGISSSNLKTGLNNRGQ